jgi:hypothetical protein
MLANGKPRIKSINEEYTKGDLVLIKDGSSYHLGAFNDVFMEIIRENLDIPKSDIELELDRRRKEHEEKMKSLELAGIETEKEKYLKVQQEKRNKYFVEFKRQFGLPSETTMDRLFVEVPEALGAFDTYMEGVDAELEEAGQEFEVDESGDGPE